MTVENGDYGEFKGSTKQALGEIHEDVRIIRERLDHICIDHERRLGTLESGARIFRWIFMAMLALLTYLGLKP